MDLNGNGESLDNLCVELGILRKSMDEVQKEEYWTNRPHPDILLSAALEMDALLNHEMIIMGGFVVHPRLLGYRRMRSSSNDFDCITSPKGIRTLNTTFSGNDKFYRSQEYGDLFLEFQNFPWGFDVGITHGWKIPRDFYSTCRTFTFEYGKKQVNLISPEYLIALKTRRSHFKGRVFGKDTLDFANVILAPRYRKELPEIDLERTAHLIYEHVDPDYETIKQYVEPMGCVQNHLALEERNDFYRLHQLFLSEIRKRYATSIYTGVNFIQ